MKIKLGDAIRQCIELNDDALAKKLVKTLRYDHGFMHSEIYEVVHNVKPNTTNKQWNDLLS